MKESELPTLNGLLCFEATVRHGSMTLAAEDLGITQPLVSQRIRALEDVVGGILIDRSKKPVTPTVEGLKYYNELRGSTSSILRATDNARKDFRDTKTKISISAYFGFAFHWIMPRLQRLQQAFPVYLFEIQPTNSLSDLTTAHADILFHFSSKIGKYQFEKMLIPEVVFPVCSPNFAIKHGLKAGQMLSDLRNLPLLHKDVDDSRWLNWQRWAQALNVKPSSSPILFRYNNYPLIVEAAIGGHGLCLGWEGLINPFIEDGKLVELGPRLKSETRGYQICSDQYANFAIGNVIKWFINEVEQD
jgi:DNA-binding transcriptional LysR family regulator